MVCCWCHFGYIEGTAQQRQRSGQKTPRFLHNEAYSRGLNVIDSAQVFTIKPKCGQKLAFRNKVRSGSTVHFASFPDEPHTQILQHPHGSDFSGITESISTSRPWDINLYGPSLSINEEKA